MTTIQPAPTRSLPRPPLPAPDDPALTSASRSIPDFPCHPAPPPPASTPTVLATPALAAPTQTRQDAPTHNRAPRPNAFSDKPSRFGPSQDRPTSLSYCAPDRPGTAPTDQAVPPHPLPHADLPLHPGANLSGPFPTSQPMPCLHPGRFSPPPNRLPTSSRPNATQPVSDCPARPIPDLFRRVVPSLRMPPRHAPTTHPFPAHLHPAADFPTLSAAAQPPSDWSRRPIP